MAIDLHVRVTSTGSDELTKKLKELNAQIAQVAQTSEKTLLASMKRQEAGLLRQRRTIDTALRSYQRLHAQMTRMGAPAGLIGGLASSFKALEASMKGPVITAERFQAVTHRYARATQNASEALRRWGGANREAVSHARRQAQQIQQVVVLQNKLDKTQKEATRSGGNFSKRLRDIGSSAVLTFGPLSGVGSRIIALLAIFQRGGPSLLGIAFASAVATTVALVTVLGHAVAAATRAETAMLGFQAALKLTGRDAEITAGQLDNLARKLAQDTLASTGDARTAAQSLLAFPNLPTSQLEAVLKVSQDLASAGFGNLTENARIVGRALDAPAQALDSLREKGVNLTYAMKEQIKTFVALGEESKAQAIIMGELQERTAGVGRGAAGGLAGAFDTLRENFLRLLEVLGTPLLEEFTKGVIILADIMDRFALQLGAPIALKLGDPDALKAQQGFVEREIARLRDEKKVIQDLVGILGTNPDLDKRLADNTLNLVTRLTDLQRIQDALAPKSDVRGIDTKIQGVSEENFMKIREMMREISRDRFFIGEESFAGLAPLQQETIQAADSLGLLTKEANAFTFTMDENGKSVRINIEALAALEHHFRTVKDAMAVQQIFEENRTALENFIDEMERLDLLRSRNEKTFEDMFNKTGVDQYREAIRRAAGITEDTFKTALEKFNEEMIKHNLLLEEGALKADEFAIATARAKAELASNFPIFAQFESGVQSLGDAIVNFAFDTEDAMENLKSTLVRILQDISEELFRMAVTNPLLNQSNIGAERSTLGGFLGALPMLLGNLFGGGGGVASAPPTNLVPAGFQHGGSFIVPNSGPSDSRSIAVSPGERVTVDTPFDVAAGRSRVGGGPTVYIDARGADRQGMARLEKMVHQINGSIEKRAVAAVVVSRDRQPRLLSRRG